VTRVLITGASGFIGHNVLLRAPRDWEVIAGYHNTRSLETFVDRHRLTHVRPVRCDLTDPADVARLARELGRVDRCLYLAANGDPARSASEPAWDLRLNALALVTLLEQVRFEHLVYVSSGAVYDGSSGPVSPRSPIAPRLPYAIAKLTAEHYVRSLAERRGTVGSYVNVRFFGAFGPYEPPRKITSRWMRAVMAGRREFTIRGDGENLIDLMYVDDAVDGFLRLLAASPFSGTVDLASGAPVTVNEIARSMAEVLGAELKIAHEGRTEEYIQFRSVDPTMRERFRFEPTVPFGVGVRRLYDFLQHETHDTGQPA
jgi:nucleoside-diphosphate-sugar epimerase